MMGSRRAFAVAITLVAGLLISGPRAYAAAPNNDPPPVTTVHKSWRSIVINSTDIQPEVAKRRGDDFERRSTGRAKADTAKRVLTKQEVAVETARRRAACLAALNEAVRIYAATGRAARMSADGCSIIRDGVVKPAVVTDQVVLTEVRKVGFPASVVHVQPGRTLVNLDTNVYADPKVFDRPVLILGQLVAIKATPSYTWRFGDGSSETTAGPGAPYPEGDVTHRYLQRGEVSVSVTLNYDTWYRVPGEDWKQAGVIEIPGPATAVRVCEARPVLTDSDNPEPSSPDAAMPGVCA